MSARASLLGAAVAALIFGGGYLTAHLVDDQGARATVKHISAPLHVAASKTAAATRAGPSIARIEQELRAERRLASHPPCNAHEQAHEAEVVIYGGSCTEWIRDATGNSGLTGLFSGLWAPGLSRPIASEARICAVKSSGGETIEVLDAPHGDIGTTICETLVHAGWAELSP